MVGDPRSTRRWQILREQCYRRDRKANALCWICGQQIDYRAKPGTPDAWEGDHIKDVKRHPELAFDPGNVAPSHCSCNRSRGIKDRANQIGKPSETW